MIGVKPFAAANTLIHKKGPRFREPFKECSILAFGVF